MVPKGLRIDADIKASWCSSSEMLQLGPQRESALGKGVKKQF